MPIYPYIDNNVINKVYYDIVDELHKSFLNSLNQQQDILKDLVSLDAKITDEELKRLSIRTQKVIQTMKYDCERLYNAAITKVPVTSQEEINMQEQFRIEMKYSCLTYLENVRAHSTQHLSKAKNEHR